MNSLVSVLIINYNGKKWLKPCLDALLNQTYKPIEIIFVDNASSDGSVELVKKAYPQVKLVISKDNLGFAGGNNLGYKHAKGEFILLLNNDTIVEKDFVRNFVKGFAEIPKAGILQSKIVLMYPKGIIDTCGSYLTTSTFLYHCGNGKSADLDQYNKPFQVFTVKGAAMLIKREVIDKVELFDDDFWCYYEETDLCHRAWLSGYQSWYWPYAMVLHGAGGTSLSFPNDFIQFHNFKNKLLSMLKNFEVINLVFIIPVFVLLNIGLSLIWTLQGKFNHALSLYKAIWWNVIHFGKTREKRKTIQAKRKITDKTLFSMCLKNPDLKYYYYLFKDNIAGYKD